MTCERSAGGGREVGVRVGMAGDSPHPSGDTDAEQTPGPRVRTAVEGLGDLIDD
jgi:hypothetical protein